MKGHRELIHMSRDKGLESSRLAAEDASGVGEGKELPKGTTDTKKEDL